MKLNDEIDFPLHLDMDSYMIDEDTLRKSTNDPNATLEKEVKTINFKIF